MAKRSEAIRIFLDMHTHPDLARLYNPDMETQVNVAKDGGDRVENSEDYRGKAWTAWSDGIETWSAFRMPKNANTDPVENDFESKFNLESHAEGIGMTGWDWRNRLSRWVAYDFDAMLGHSENHGKKLTDSELREIEDVVTKLPFITLRKSTSGRGLHLYIHLEPFPTANHTEHAALARSILSMVAGRSGFNFTDKVDICGGNMWIWHRKMRGTDGLKLIRDGHRLSTDMIPDNWRDHLNVVTRRSTRAISVAEQQAGDLFDELTGQRAKIKLDAEHLKLINWLNDNKLQGYWRPDDHMLVTHTSYLDRAHTDLKLRGEFYTMSGGKDWGHDINCFSGDTEVITRDGVKTLKELHTIGGAELLVWNGKDWEWIWSPVQYFGKQETVSILFGNDTVCRATRNHQWLWMEKLRNQPGHRISKKRKPTTKLRLNKTQLPLAQRILPIPSEEGYAHGFVYGDGNRYERSRGDGYNTTRVTLFKNDNDLRNCLLQFGTDSYEYRGEIRHNVILNMPANWKELPDNPTQEYALGFILGLMSADGFVYGTSGGIFQSGSYDTIREIRNLAVHAGLQCYGIKSVVKSEGSFPSELPHWTFRFSLYNISVDMLKRSDHKSAWKKAQTLCTTPNYISPDSRSEDVYCAVVPKFHNFTLANGVTSGNCFMYPCRNGVWAVRRYGTGTKEHKFWRADNKGWTRCYFNRELILEEVARLFEAVELENRSYQFPSGKQASEALLKLGVDCQLPEWAAIRAFKIRENPTDGKYICTFQKLDNDPGADLPGWAVERQVFKRIFHNPRRGVEDESSILGDYDDIIRHVVSDHGDDLGWMANTGTGDWRTEPINHVKLLLKSKGIGAKEVDHLLGCAVSRAWLVVNRPFQPEYPGDRQWNRSRARFRIPPTIEGENLSFPTWQRILDHCGTSLTEPIRSDEWCRENGISTGGEYLKMWLACLIKHPHGSLPYLGFYGEQNTGKSTFHEAFCEIILSGGWTRADTALTSQSGFNGELEDSILCIVEETNVMEAKNKGVYNRLKDMVTSSQISIHRKGYTPTMAPNYTHWVQCANKREYIPVFAGDTRVTLIYVPELSNSGLIPKRDMRTLLTKEAPDFLASLLSMDIPDSRDRLMLPVIKTMEKEQAEYQSMTPVEQFFQEKVHRIDGAYISAKDLHTAFIDWIKDPMEQAMWTSNKFGREIPSNIVKGRISQTKTQDRYYANITLDPTVIPGKRWVNRGPTFLGQM